MITLKGSDELSLARSSSTPDAEFFPHPSPRATTDTAERAMRDTLQQISRDVGHSGDPGMIPDELLCAILKHSPWSQCSAAIFDLDSGNLIARFHAGFDPGVPETWSDHLEAGSPTRTALMTNALVSIPDVRQSEQYGSWTARYVDGYASSLYIPVSMRPGEGAVLSVHRAVAHEFSDGEFSLATAIASFAAIAFRNMIARDHALEAESAANERLSQLNQLVMNQNEVVSRQNESLRTLSTAHARLLEVQLQGIGVNGLCQALTGLLDAPVVLLDRFHQVLGSAGLANDRAELVSERYALHSGAAAKVRPGSRPSIVELDGQRLLVGIAVDGQSEAGVLIAVDPETDNQELLSQVAELGCLHVSLEILNLRASIETEARAQRDFISALLAPTTTGLDLKRRAALLGIQLDSPHQVLAARVSSGVWELATRDASELGAAMKRHLADVGIRAAVAPTGPADFVIVLPIETHSSVSPLATVTALARRTLRDGIAVLAGTGTKDVVVQVGVGAPGSGVEALRASHDGAFRALDVMSIMGVPEGELKITDAGIFALLAAMPAGDRHDCVERYLRALITYDRDHGSDLVETLGVYFELVGNAQRVAEVMYLHVSTVRYRLSRVEQLARVSLRRSEDRLCLELALRLAIMSGEIRGNQLHAFGAGSDPFAA